MPPAAQYSSSLGAACRMTAVFAAQSGKARDQFGVTSRQAILVELDVVLDPGAHMAAELEAPFVDVELMPRDAGGGPGRVRHDLLEFADQEFEQLAPGRQRIRDAHDELHLAWPLAAGRDRPAFLAL